MRSKPAYPPEPNRAGLDRRSRRLYWIERRASDLQQRPRLGVDGQGLGGQRGDLLGHLVIDNAMHLHAQPGKPFLELRARLGLGHVGTGQQLHRAAQHPPVCLRVGSHDRAAAPVLQRVQHARQLQRLGQRLSVCLVEFLPLLRDERGVESGPFERLPNELGPYHVREDADLLRITEANLDNYSTVRKVRRDLISRVHADGHGIGGIDRWFPNDIAVMRYQLGSHARYQ